MNTAAFGTLYLVPVPIGNPDDISLRALQTLRAVSCIAVETVAVARRHLAYWDISTRLLSYSGKLRVHNHSELLSLLKDGHDVALICDSGTPGIAEPGFAFVTVALQTHVRVVALPGPTAVMVALAASGLPVNRFLFDGFPPRDATERKLFFQRLAYEERTIVLFEYATGVKAALKALQQSLGAERQVAVAWNLTRPSELWLRGTLTEVLASLNKQRRHGEVTIVLAGLPLSPVSRIFPDTLFP